MPEPAGAVTNTVILGQCDARPAVQSLASVLQIRCHEYNLHLWSYHLIALYKYAYYYYYYSEKPHKSRGHREGEYCSNCHQLPAKTI